MVRGNISCCRGGIREFEFGGNLWKHGGKVVGETTCVDKGKVMVDFYLDGNPAPLAFCQLCQEMPEAVITKIELHGEDILLD